MSISNFPFSGAVQLTIWTHLPSLLFHLRGAAQASRNFCILNNFSFFKITRFLARILTEHIEQNWRGDSTLQLCYIFPFSKMSRKGVIRAWMYLDSFCSSAARVRWRPMAATSCATCSCSVANAALVSAGVFVVSFINATLITHYLLIKAEF